jgi:hypothetical protein
MDSKRIYQWVIEKDSDGFYSVSGFVCNGSSKDRDGAVAVWSYIEGVLEHIRKQEQDLKRKIE